ncbi:MAG: acetylglutamate kinase [Coriobacteriia bacterium]|nr:acetylglutamate kinase [Coriobacteriia bacterium]
MKYAKDRIMKSSHTGEVLTEALPWIKIATGKTVVIKYGGAAMVDTKLRDAVMSDIVMLKIMGMNPVIVHGGGAAISENMERFGLPVEFKNGQRVTTDEAMDIVKMTLIGKVNEELVLAVNAHGNLAVGVNGADAGTLTAVQKSADLGRVGTVTDVDPTYIQALIAADYIPIVATVAKGEDGGSYNVNADAAASALAAALGAHKIIYLTDVDGFYEDFSDKDSLVSQMSLAETRAMLAEGKVSKGMIPKLQSCVASLEAGVPRAHIVNGTKPHSILIELLTTGGSGTLIHEDESSHVSLDDMAPLGNLASRLTENR